VQTDLSLSVLFTAFYGNTIGQEYLFILFNCPAAYFSTARFSSLCVSFDFLLIIFIVLVDTAFAFSVKTLLEKETVSVAKIGR